MTLLSRPSHYVRSNANAIEDGSEAQGVQSRPKKIF